MISAESQIYDIFLWLSDFQFYIHARHLALSRAFPEKFKVDLMAPLKVRNTQYKDKCEYVKKCIMRILCLRESVA